MPAELTVAAGILRRQRRSIGLWSVALAAVATMYCSFYPAIGTDGLDEMISSMPQALVDAFGMDQMATGAGYVTAAVYSLLGVALTLVCLISLGGRLIAGQEEDGTLELELTAPITRRAVYLGSLAALWVQAVAVVAVITLTVGLLTALLDLGIGGLPLLGTGVAMVLMVGLMGTIALVTGAATGRRSVAVGVGAAVAVVSYIGHAVGRTIGADWFAAASPFEWYVGGRPLVDGPGAGSVLLLAGVAAGVAALGPWLLGRRDLMV